MTSMKSWLVGNAVDCDLVINQPAVSGQHCRLIKKADGYYLEDLQSTNGTYVNGQRLSTAQRVSPTDKITLGQKIPLPWPDTESATSERIVSIGQAADNDIVINHAAISGHHARLTIRGSQMELEDLESTNGTFVGSTSQRIQKSAVGPDDRVFFGTHEIAFRKLLAAANIDLTNSAVPAPDQPRTAAISAVSRPTAQAQATHAPLVEKKDWSDYLLPGVAGVALLVICVVGVLMFSSSFNKPDNTESSSQAVSKEPTAKKVNSIGDATKVRVNFRMGTYKPEHIVERIKVTIRVGADEQDLNEPVDLDLGAGFLLRLSPVKTESPSSTLFPRTSSLETTESTVAAGKSAWFEFSAEDGDEFNRTAQVFSNFSFDQISKIRFSAEGKTAWVLQGYVIEINGELFASHDSVNWEVEGKRSGDHAELAKLVSRQEALETESADLEIYIQKGNGGAGDKRALEEQKNAIAVLKETIKTLRASLNDPIRSYEEKDLAFAPGRSTTTSPSKK